MRLYGFLGLKIKQNVLVLSIGNISEDIFGVKAKLSLFFLSMALCFYQSLYYFMKLTL